LTSFRNEKSAGFLIFRRDDNEIRYLFLKNRDRFDVPKGLKQPDEDDLTAALRELKEETGIENPNLIPGFKEKKHYFYRWGNELVSKEVVYFLAESKSAEVRISGEHDGYSWLTKQEALAEIKYKSLREIVLEADPLLTVPALK
jgi:8-oxo-dGTP pyrophosphatase MutT (NUDIX family)